MGSLLSRFFGYLGGLFRLQAQADPNNPAVWSPLGGGSPIYARTNSGETITVERALSVGAYYAGVKFISQTIGMTPISMYRRIDDKTKEKAPNHPLHDLLHSEPSPYWTPLTWKQQMTADAINAGNGFSRIVWRGTAVDRFIPLDPYSVITEFRDDGEPVYLLHKGTEKEERIAFDDMFHLPGFGGNFTGISTVVLAKETLGLALALEQHATRYFSNNAMLAGTIEFPETVGSIKAETYDRLLASFNREHQGGEKAHLWKLLEHGAKANPLSATNEQSQFLEARRFIIEELARWLGLRPHTLGSLERAIKSNIEEQARELLMFDLLPWYVKWEQVIKRDLIMAPQTYFAKFNVDMLLRGDMKAQWEAFKVGIEHGVYSPDDVRAMVDENPRPDGRGSRYWEPQANFTTAQGSQGSGDGEGATAVQQVAETYIEAANGNSRARAIVEKTVDGIVRKEIAAMERWGPRHASKNGVWEKWLEDWYGKHQACLVDRLALDPGVAESYCRQSMGEVLAEGYGTAATWLPRKKEWLVAAAMGGNGQ